MRRAYLSGPITGCTYKGATEWRTSVRLELEDAGFTVLDPMRGKSFLSNQRRISDEAGASAINPRISDKALVMRDRSDVNATDIMLVNLLGSRIVSIGTMFELAWANLLHKLTVIVVEPENIHAKHPFVRESGVIFSDLEAAVDYVKSCHVREGA
jgi:nucleoside 2-deoxyribosyltransferase